MDTDRPPLAEESLLTVENMSVEFDVGDSPVQAVRDVSFSITNGEIYGIVGESGSGKSTIALALMQLLDEEGSITNGSIWYHGDDIATYDQQRMRALRGSDISMVFQDPLSGLNPVLTIGSQVAESIAATSEPAPNGTLLSEIRRRLPSGKANRERVIEVLSKVGIPAPADRLDSYPHEFSGGMRQRVMIAMAIAAEPDLLIVDEPTTALDVTIQANILSLLDELSDSLNMAVLIISHNLSVIAQMCDRVAVMYAGQIVERGATTRVLNTPRHPYTDGLRRSMPQFSVGEELESIPGTVPDLAALPSGCTFKDRCPNATPECEQEPALEPYDDRDVRCVNPVLDGDADE